jgi:hypothetical protein
MKLLSLVAIALGLSVGTALLASCGPKESASETPNSSTTTTPVTPPETPSPPYPKPEPPASPGNETTLNPLQRGTLTAQQKDSQINLRSQPSTDATAEGYGLVGDRVELQKVTTGSDGLTWYYVKFFTSGAEGWIRGDFIQIGEGTEVSQASSEVDIDSFTTDELFGVGSGGCGMTLMPVNTRDFIFFNGLEGEEMWMKLDGKMTKFRRTDASGSRFYGQSSSQSFVSEDGNTQVEVTVDVGSEERYEAVNIESGTLRLEQGSDTEELSVIGDAGC